jgi:hypothetical protein
VARDDTVRIDGRTLQLPAAPRRFAYSGKMVEIHLRLDGSATVFDGERELVTQAAPPGASELRIQHADRPGPGFVPAAATVPWIPSDEHPWKKMTPARRAKAALTDSLNR